jgi:hypothetical protein
VVIWEEDN